ncbi:MAG: hypothetical protein HOM68_09755 [Gemmatimonadetes bacterium]|nr:hypothetical protein [Gemmatimonadota bacterium]MBT5056812.1 hypothetical protein [Gemmatimonadota bacterium]MBT5143521.1 hypothetical protein [Gemmatimonadota bacterium]MBT5590212.1 hypothetical protein [Gemmatimonadota bacterium]MBT5963675.1 hypothetical protein [Gemmatimonadota bacterium]
MVGLLLIGAAGSVGADSIQGYVLHGTTQEPVADVEIGFLIGAEEGAMSPMASTVSSHDGRFEFSGPFLRSGTQFALSAEYGGISYPSSLLVVGEQDEIIVEVYDVGGNVTDLRIASHNIFLGLRDQTLEVAQLVQANNSGSQTYAGRQFGDHQRGLEFQIPEAMTGLVAHTGELIRLSATRLFDTQSLPPGSSQVAFTFQVPAESFDGSYVHEILYPTQSLDFFVQPVSVELGTPFHDHGVVDLHGQQYRHYRAQDLPVGQRLVIELPFSQPIRWALKWVLLALVPAIITGLLAVVGRPVALARIPLAKVDADSSQARSERQHILQQLAQVQQERAQAQGEAAIELERKFQTLMQQAREIYRHLPKS